MVVRDNYTWEKVSQKLTKAIKSGKSYTFSIDLARSKEYLSMSRVTNKPANYNDPIKLRIFGGTEICGKQELLGETSLIKNTHWLPYSFKFKPIQDYNYIVLEACLLYTSPSPRDATLSRMPSSA